VQPGLLLVRGLLLLSVGLSGCVLILPIAGCWLFVSCCCHYYRRSMYNFKVRKGNNSSPSLTPQGNHSLGGPDKCIYTHTNQ
jgi:hypothetical protein